MMANIACIIEEHEKKRKKRRSLIKDNLFQLQAQVIRIGEAF